MCWSYTTIRNQTDSFTDRQWQTTALNNLMCTVNTTTPLLASLSRPQDYSSYDFNVQ